MDEPIDNLLVALTAAVILNASSAVAQSSIRDRYAVVEASSNYAPAITEARAEVAVLMDAGAPGVSIAVGVNG